MRAGSLRSVVSVQQRSATLDSFGQQSTTWTEIAQVPAEITAMGGQELVAARAMNTEVSHRITVRYDATLWANPKTAAAYRLVYNGRYFNIHALENEGERNRMVILQASEGLNLG